jgi:hypothetical protein
MSDETFFILIAKQKKKGQHKAKQKSEISIRVPFESKKILDRETMGTDVYRQTADRWVTWHT